MSSLVGIIVAILLFIVLPGAIIKSVRAHYAHIQAYKITLVTLHKDGEQIGALCAKYRPTWGVINCVKKVGSQNKGLNFDHLAAGQRIFFDKHLGTDGNGHYQNSLLVMGRQFRTIAAACTALRPTWKLKPCIERTKDYNRLPPAGTPPLGVQIILPANI